MGKNGKEYLFYLIVVLDFWAWFGPLHQFLSCCVFVVFSISLKTILISRLEDLLLRVSSDVSFPSPGDIIVNLPTLVSCLLLDNGGGWVLGCSSTPRDTQDSPHDYDLMQGVSSVTVGNPWFPCMPLFAGPCAWSLVDRFP